VALALFMAWAWAAVMALAHGCHALYMGSHEAFGAWLTWTVNQFDNVWLHWLCAVHICHSSSKNKHFIQLEIKLYY
jgi:hypothetical protein